MSSFRVLRERMVETQLAARGIRDRRVLEAMREVPRHWFVDEANAASAYADTPLPIGHGQTISQPYMVAWALENLRLFGPEKVLEVGTGSGYQAALLARLASSVCSIERDPELRRRARAVLDALGFHEVKLREGDGSLGWTEEAPFDRILVAAAAPEVPAPLLGQLSEGGILEVPVGRGPVQDLVRVARCGGKLRRDCLGRCAFVPLVGIHGFPGPECPSGSSE